MFARIARDLSLAEVRRFFMKYICLRESQVVTRLKRRGTLREITFISRLMSTGSLGAAASGNRHGVWVEHNESPEKAARQRPRGKSPTVAFGESLQAQPTELA
jgi:hypothetical protein